MPSSSDDLPPGAGTIPERGSKGNPVFIEDPELGKWTGKLVEWTENLVWWTRALVGATVISAVIAACQWRALHDADDTANRTLIAAERAWVAPIDASFENIPILGQRNNVIIHYNNIGKEPATNLVIPRAKTFTASIDILKGITRSDQIDKIVDECKLVQPNLDGRVSWPINSPKNYELTYPVEPIRLDNNSFAIIGCFAYKTFSEVKHTAFCFYFEPGVTNYQSLNLCQPGQYAN